MLLGNYSVLNKMAGRSFGNFPADSRANWNKSGAARGMFYGWGGSGMDKKDGVPRGYRPPYSWVIPQESGGMASINMMLGSTSMTITPSAIFLGTVTMGGSSSLSATMQAILSGVTTMAGVSSMTGTTLTGIGDMELIITPFTGVAPENLASAVWDALTADYGNTGSMGKALNDAGGSGNPWASTISGNTGAGTFGEAVGKKILTVAKFLGLK